jgi:AbrB family looped-hinge helix DNA binding protein
MPTATMTSKGQITVPVQVRKALGLKAGDRIDIFETEGGQYAFRPKTGNIMDLYGILPKPDFTVSIEEMNQAILERAAELDDRTKTQFLNDQVA